MSAFKDPRWPMQAALNEQTKQWEVTYVSRTAGRPARELFVNEEAAIKFADANAGKVRLLEHRGGYK